MFFDNEVKKNVNLRGQKTESKKNFVQRVEQERLQRQLQKQKQQAALKIQSVWRGTREIAKIREAARISWNPEFSSSSPITNQIQNLTRQLLFFYRDTPSDNSRLDKLCAILLSNVSSNSKSTDPNINICCITPTNLQQWTLQIKKLLVLCQRRLAVQLDTYLQLMLLLTDMNNVNTLIPNFNKNEIASKLTSYMVANGFYVTMSKLLQQYLPEISNVANVKQDKIVLLQIFTALSVRPVQYTATNASSQFLRHILSIPNFSQRLPTSLYGPYINMLPILLASNVNSILNDSTSNLNLLGNLLGFSKLYIQFLEHSKNEKSMTIALLNSYIKWLGSLTKSLVPLLKNILQSNSSESSLLFDQFKNITDNKFIQVIYTNSTNSIVIESTNIYLTFLIYWKSYTVQLLNSLTFSTSLVPTLWKYLLSSSNFQDLIQNLYSESSNTNNDIANVLLLFGKCYNHLLFTMDDSEFFDFQSPFSKSQIQDMVRIIRKMVFKMYWNRDVLLSETFFQLRDTLTILLHSLYDRDSRHAFCSENTWIEEELIGIQLENADDRVKILLEYIPFVISFTQRLKLFYDVITLEKQTQTQTSPLDAYRVSIRRDYLFEDGFAKLNSLNEKLKGTIRVELTSSNGTVEAGIDGGGVFKEFFSLLVTRSFNIEYGLFKETADRRLYPNPQSNAIISDDSRQFEFLGKILGKAVYENILVELPLANFFLAKLLGKYNYVHDLVFLDPDVYKNVNRLRNMENIEELSLTFTTMEEVFGKPELVELIPGGKDILVTNENKIKFIARLADYKLNQSIKRQSAAFLAGFQQIIPTQLLKIFNQNELQTLISGTLSAAIDIPDLQKHCVYSGGYHADHPVIQRFWKVLSSFNTEQQQQFLMFVTSCSRAPLLGFGYLQPAFCIHQALPTGYNVDQYLPTASTCMNFFKLPPYTSEETMRQKILYAVTSKAGFELS